MGQFRFFRKPENTTSPFIILPKKQKKSHLSCTTLFYSHKKHLYHRHEVSEKQKLALIRCSLCLRQACMTCAIANECHVVCLRLKSYMHGGGGGSRCHLKPQSSIYSTIRSALVKVKTLLSTWTINFFKTLNKPSQKQKLQVSFYFCVELKSLLVFVDYRVPAGGAMLLLLFWIGTLKWGVCHV